MQELAVSLFGGIKKKNVNIPYWNDPIYTKEQLATKTVVVPIKDIRVLSVNFPIPEQSKNYHSLVKMINFIIYICAINFEN